MLQRLSQLDWPRALYSRRTPALLGIAAVLSIFTLVMIRSNVDADKLSPMADIAFSTAAAIGPAGLFTLLVFMAFFWLKCDSSSKDWRTIWFFVLLFGFPFGTAVAYYALVYLPAVRKKLRYPERDTGEFALPGQAQPETGRIGPFSRQFLMAWGVGILLIAVTLVLPGRLSGDLLMPVLVISFLLGVAAVLEAAFHIGVSFYRSGISRPAAPGRLHSPSAKDHDQ